MSGGVDSSAVAALLHSEGRDVVGMTMQLWNQQRMPELIPEGGATGRCCSLDDVYDARWVADSIGIPFYVVNFEDRFEEQVVRPFVDDYVSGRTPIPCTLCNNFIKFDQFIEMAEQAGAKKIATGHYARINQDAETGRWRLLRGVDHSRDQSYFLFGLTQEQLAKTLFPLGHLEKAEVRDLARRLSVPIADKGESREICFVPNGDYARFVELYREKDGRPVEESEGELVTTDGRTLAEHQGVHRFTIGQRKGLGVAIGEPLYVTEIQAASKKVVVGPKRDLLRKTFTAKDLNWVSLAPPDGPVEVEAKIRYKFPPTKAVVRPIEGGRVEVEFAEPQLSVTPGQAAVFYQGDAVAGGGWIE